ncbi:MAG: DUF6291 domain-containing protein [Muribaculum sp.]|nr:DUF6291 domain-containing protein [Muribaculum sp.]
MRHTTARAPRFDREWKEMIALLPENRQSVIENAIREYQLTGMAPTELEGAEMMAFMLIKKIVDRRKRQRDARLRRSDATVAASPSKAPMATPEPKTHPVISRGECSEASSKPKPSKMQPYMRNRRCHAGNLLTSASRPDSHRQSIVRRINRLNKKALRTR